MKTQVLKPFDLKKVKDGATIVCGINRRPARIISYTANSKFCIVALVSDKDEEEFPLTFTIDGTYRDDESSDIDDLFILEEADSYITFDDIYDVDLALENHMKQVSLNKLFIIASYYNKKEVNWDYEHKYLIYYNNCDNCYEIYTYHRENIGTPCFLNKEDAQSVIDNPNFKVLLDLIYKQ